MIVGFSYKLILMYILCAELSATNCGAELSAPNSPASNCPDTLPPPSYRECSRCWRRHYSCWRLSQQSCQIPLGEDFFDVNWTLPNLRDFLTSAHKHCLITSAYHATVM